LFAHIENKKDEKIKQDMWPSNNSW